VVLRIFSVQKDGSYHEVPPIKESFLHEGDAFLIIDRKDKKIFIFRKTGISSSLAYSAGRAATNLRTKKGSKYQVINIEPEDKDRLLSYIINKLEEKPTNIRIEPEAPIQQSNYVYGEKTRSLTQPIANAMSKDVFETIEIPKETKVDQDRVSSYEIESAYDVEEIVKTLASKILFDTSIQNIKEMEKPPRDKLKAELVKIIDSLLDRIY
jgi:hypothetical protein